MRPQRESKFGQVRCIRGQLMRVARKQLPVAMASKASQTPRDRVPKQLHLSNAGGLKRFNPLRPRPSAPYLHYVLQHNYSHARNEFYRNVDAAYTSTSRKGNQTVMWRYHPWPQCAQKHSSGISYVANTKARIHRCMLHVKAQAHHGV